MIGLNDGAGARIKKGRKLRPMEEYSMKRAILWSNPTNQRSAGPCALGAVYSPAMTDFIFMVREKSHMFITGPDVVKTVTGEEVTLEELGGASSHASKSGVATFVSDSEKKYLTQLKPFSHFFPVTIWRSHHHLNQQMTRNVSALNSLT